MTAAVVALLLGLALGAVHGRVVSKRGLRARQLALQLAWGLAILAVFVLYARGLWSEDGAIWAAGSVGFVTGNVVGMLTAQRKRTPVVASLRGRGG